ncbi:MAG: rRNA maturation RNase YbeY [Anaerolineae bacterium]|nr:rRNA maturation RNase YbeY [Anaerolineae bacterium]
MTIPHTIEIQTEVPLEGIDEKLLRLAALVVLKHQHIAEAIEMTIVIAGDEALRDLNRRFLGIDHPTDVLSFPEDTRGPFASGGGGFPRYLGDIVISLPRATSQAREVSCTVVEEVQLLIVHGTLHLLGYDHGEPGEKARMWAVQAEILELLNIKAPLPE